MEPTHVLSGLLWWLIIAAALVLLWQLAGAVKALTAVLKKFENFKITELPPSMPAPVAPPPAVAVAAVAPAAPVAATSASDAIPGEMMAVIAAAVDAVMSGPYRIMGITPVGHDHACNRPRIWSVEGRRQISESHKLR